MIQLSQTMEIDKTLKSRRLSTKEKFLQHRRFGISWTEKPIPWYRQRSNFLVMIVIVFFVFLFFMITTLMSVYDHSNGNHHNEETIESQNSPPDDDTEIDYEEAKRIFRGID